MTDEPRKWLSWRNETLRKLRAAAADLFEHLDRARSPRHFAKSPGKLARDSAVAFLCRLKPLLARSEARKRTARISDVTDQAHPRPRGHFHFHFRSRSLSLSREGSEVVAPHKNPLIDLRRRGARVAGITMGITRVRQCVEKDGIFGSAESEER